MTMADNDRMRTFGFRMETALLREELKEKGKRGCMTNGGSGLATL